MDTLTYMNIADFCYTNMLVDINNDKLYKLYKTEDKVLEFY